MPSDSKPLKASGSLVSSNWLECSPLDQGTGQGKDPAVPGWSEKLRLNAAQLVIPEGIADNYLAKVLEECGALSERALLAASELEPEVFQLQVTKELKAGGLKQVGDEGTVAYADATWVEEK